nr:MAG TPA: hypothetical protein [Caudoviricetes sp.]
MVNVSQDIIKSFNEGNKQTALIEVTAGSKTFTITDADIIQGGLKIDRYCVTNSKIEVGSAVASELSLKLRNYDGKFNDVSFEGAVLNVKIGIHAANTSELGKFILGKSVLGFAKGLGNFILGTGRLGDYSVDTEVYWVPCGLFIVDTPPRKLSTISISALDYMVLFDREVNASALSFPIHVDALIQKICSICNVTLATDVSVLPNHYFSIGGLPDTNQKLTYRQLLQWCAQLTGTCAFMDGSGRLVLKWYEQTGVTITASERYSSDMLENDITITGFTCDDGKGNTYLSGTADYTLDLSDCGFLTNAYEGVLKELQAARGGFAYRPYSATIKSAPYLFPMDMIRYKDKDGAFHNTIVTNVTFSLNCNTSISGAGETVTSSSYIQSNSGVTNQQASTNRQTNESLETKATKKELHSMMTFTESEGLVITHEGWNGKVQITGEDIRVVRGNNKVVITDSGISITDGSGSCTIASGKVTFSGLCQDKIWENGDPGSGIGNGAVICNDGRLRQYSAIVIGFGEYYTGLDGSGVNGSDLQYTVFPINGIWSIASRVWDYPRVRRVHVSYSGITFGQGGFYKENAFQTGVKFEKHDTCCVPCAVYGLM